MSQEMVDSYRKWIDDVKSNATSPEATIFVISTLAGIGNSISMEVILKRLTEKEADKLRKSLSDAIDSV